MPRIRKRKEAAPRSFTGKRMQGAATKTVETKPDDGRRPVVGVGASAGGLEALKAFFGAMPPKTGLVFVVVVHLDPTHESLMPELLSHATGLTVEQARDRQLLEPDHVYVIPPNRTLTIDQGLLQVREVADRRSLRGAIDHFFRSLAEAQRDRAVAIVLSGTGTEGTLGARAVKAEGGLVMAQAPETAAQPGMPTSVIATGIVDIVLAPDKMPDALLAYVRSTHAQEGPPAAAATKALEGLPAILAVLRARTKYDFRGYKKGTVQRRIERRMGLQQVGDVAKYLDFLRSHPAEVDQLFRDLLIGVTSFFRDSPAFEELATRVLAGLVRERDPDAPIRVWVPGCSTGEEAYSIAIMLAEQIAAAQSSCRVQIFATDVDDEALEVARAGTYPESIALDVNPQRLQRFFTREDHRYTIAKSIRESVVFAVQNLVSDPPFSKLDLVSCRNVLIYLEPEMQEKLLSLFHFALNPGGHLFLGSAEGIGPLEESFAPLSKRRRIFRRLGQGTRPPVDFPVPAPAATDAGRLGAKAVSEPTIATLADQVLLDHFAPAAVVVRSSGHIVRFYGAMERYITLPKGDATLDVLMLARDALKPALRAALHDAVRRNRQMVLETLDVKRERAHATLRVTVKPVDGPKTAERLWLIIFDEIAQPARAAPQKAGRGQADLVRRLEAELRATKKEQQHLVEQLESSNEELKAANEEVLSMNEELQSTNEELTTSKEELQSMNEELTTLNAQLQDKVHELTAVNDDLANLLVSTDIATVFLDTDLRIKRFTTAASHVLNLQNSDTGRPMNHIASNLVGVDLSRDGRTVLDTLSAVEKEVGAQDGRQYFLRALPYRSEGKGVQGVVLTLVDVTTVKQAERDLRVAHQELETRVTDRTRWLSLMHDVARAINEAATWDDAMHRVLQRLGQTEDWQVGFRYLPQPQHPETIVPVVSCFGDERFRPFHDLSMQQTYARGDRLPGRVYAENKPFWAADKAALMAALPVRSAAAVSAGLQAGVALPVAVEGEVVAVLEIFSMHAHPASEPLSELMQNVSDQIGRVLERERATARMADFVWREQQGLLHTLHDSLGQTLTGLGMLSTGLRKRLEPTDAETAHTAAEIARQAQGALDQVRRLAKSLFPVEVEAESLIAALRGLASTTEELHKIHVRVEGEPPRALHDGKIATELYRIAQEAITNSVRHAHAKVVTIRLEGRPGLLQLRISDDGIGIPHPEPSNGTGLRIMRHRAASVGASLSVERGTTSGTIVSCTLREPPGLES